MAERKINYTIGSIAREAPKFVKYLKENYKDLTVKKVKGSDGPAGLVFICSEDLEHHFEISSAGKPIGCYGFIIEPVDSDVELKGFIFYEGHKELKWYPNEGRVDKHTEIPFP